MTTPAQLSAQIVDLMTRWNAQQDQMADWLTGDPAGGPNGDGRYPLTNAEGETELFLSLPAILDQVSSPAAAAASAQQAAETAAALAEAARIAAQAAQSAANDIRSTTLGYRDVVQVQRDDVAAKWSDVNFWYGQVNARQLEVATATTLSLQYRDESQQNALDALAARVAAEEARDAAYGYAISIDPAQFATTATVDARFQEIIGQAPATLDTLNELAAALGDDPNFATTVTASLAGKAPLVHGHVIGDVSGLQTSLDGKAALSHVHAIDQVTGLQAALDGKQAAGSYASAAHTHVIGDVTGLQSALDGKQAAGAYAAATHTHVIGDVTGLQSALDGKAALSHTHAISAVPGLQAALDGKQSALGYTPANRAGDTFTGAITVNNGAQQVVLGADGNIELTRSGGGAYIDFKDSTSEDFDFRMQVTGNAMGVSGPMSSSSSFRAPIFYDSDNTGFYVDPASGFNLVAGPGTFYSGFSGVFVANPEGNGQTLRLGAAYGLTGIYTGGNLHLMSDGGNSVVFNISNSEKGYMGAGGDLHAYGDMRAPIFYDRNDTSCYVDPNGSSRLRNLNLGGGQGFDATLHIVGSQGGYDRLTQIGPNAASKPALNIMASRSSGNADQWWSWGVQTDNTWKIQVGVGFGGNGINIDASGNFTASGNVTAYSDARLKKDVETINDALDLVCKMRGVRYTRIDTENRNVGVIAQEMAEVCPEVVQMGAGDCDTLSVSYGSLVGVLIEAIKELRGEVEQLKKVQST